METILYSRPSLESMMVISIIKFKMLFANLTGYDLMFEASKKDTDYAKQPTEKPKKTIKARDYNWLLFSGKN